MLAARSPVWLTDLIGPRPDRPHDASVWDHAVRTIAEQRALTQLTDNDPGIGPEPLDVDARQRWQTASRHVLEARTHLDNADTHRDFGPWPLLPSRSQLDTRLAELDVLLASAPPDQRDLIGRLRDGDQLTLLDTTEALNAATEAQGARRDWILANWPHVVEYAEITRSIDARTYGPELEDLKAHLRRTSDSEPLLAALDGCEEWVDRALCRLIGRTASTVNQFGRDAIEQLAEYRARWNIVGSNPVGPVPSDRGWSAQLEALGHGVQAACSIEEDRSGAVGSAAHGRTPDDRCDQIGVELA